MSKISPFLWFDTEAEEAAKFYISVFPHSKVISQTRYDESGSQVSGRPVGSIMTINFELDGQSFTALNGGPVFHFNESISFVISCKDQSEIDYYWERLSAVPEAEQCGWLKDKFGVSWQVIPSNMEELIKTEKAVQAMLQMKKIEIDKLKQASE